jgi:ribosomal 30S subunit maturation factor RimM
MRRLTAVAAATVVALALAPAAIAAERVLVVDAPDVRKLNAASDGGFRTNDVIGMDVYSNNGKRIGEVQDFLMSGAGNLYAVVDIQDGAIERYVELSDDDEVVIPWRQLRSTTQFD